MNSQSRRPNFKTLCVVASALIAAAVCAGEVVADPIVGRDVIKFSQRPMLNTPLTDDAGFVRGFHGHDELSTAWSSFRGGEPGVPFQFEGYDGPIMTDDFADPLSSPVVHVKWWGSYLNGPLEGVKKFLISFGRGFEGRGEYRDLLSQVVVQGALSPGSGTFTEKQVFPLSVDGPIYEYNAELYLGKEFAQRPDALYSLSIAALVDIGPNQNPLTDPSVIRWGWHTRDYSLHNPHASSIDARFSDSVAGALPPSTIVWKFGLAAAPGDFRVRRGVGGSFVMPRVTGNESGQGPQNYETAADGPLAIAAFPRDLAFELYTVPEPASMALVLIAIAARCLGRRRPRSTRRPA